MSLLRQDPSHYPTVCYWKQIWLPLEKSVGTGQAGCEVSQQYSPSLQQQDLPEMFTMSLYFIALDGILLQHFFQYMHHVRSNPQSFVRGICNIQFYKEQYDVLPTVPACSWEMWGPFPVTGIGVDHCPVCPGAAVCLCAHLPLPSVSTALTAESPSSEAGPALLEILDMET